MIYHFFKFRPLVTKYKSLYVTVHHLPSIYPYESVFSFPTGAQSPFAIDRKAQPLV